ncbi:hypothetical protein B0H21DRAFT_730992 [Amylocystis lapponica]|nr:hypothetical protein B0H21DRAFT_730992 [Amylocystis lapponica]
MLLSASSRHCRQFCLLRPACLRTVLRRNASSSNPYPYPTTTNPSPSQIFHLPQGASRNEVKARYYELVRIYHPDAQSSRSVPPETAHARFQAISAAYGALSGKSRGSTDAGGSAHARSEAHNLSAAMWRARQRRRAELDMGGLNEHWKDVLMFSAIVVVSCFLLRLPQMSRLTACLSRVLRHLCCKRMPRAARPWQRPPTGRDGTLLHHPRI